MIPLGTHDPFLDCLCTSCWQTLSFFNLQLRMSFQKLTEPVISCCVFFVVSKCCQVVFNSIISCQISHEPDLHLAGSLSATSPSVLRRAHLLLYWKEYIGRPDAWQLPATFPFTCLSRVLGGIPYSFAMCLRLTWPPVCFCSKQAPMAFVILSSDHVFSFLYFLWLLCWHSLLELLQPGIIHRHVATFNDVI